MEDPIVNREVKVKIAFIVTRVGIVNGTVPNIRVMTHKVLKSISSIENVSFRETTIGPIRGSWFDQ